MVAHPWRLIAELMVQRCEAAKRVHLPFAPRRQWAPGYRWDIVWQRAIDNNYPGVYDTREHQSGNMGYTWTKWGAWRAVRRAYETGVALMSTPTEHRPQEPQKKRCELCGASWPCPTAQVQAAKKRA